ncbi:MAG TPA: tRNA-binding protein [Drouetiella sp.]
MTENTVQNSETISYNDFAKVQMRVGKIVKVEDFPKARKPAFKLWIDFGTYGIKCSSAQITVHYSQEELVNRLIVAVTNFPRKQIADFFSEVLVLGASQDDGSIVLLSVDKDVPLGSAIS